MLMFIKNKSQLLLNSLDKNQLSLRRIGLQALEKSIFAVKPKRIIEKSIKLHKNILSIKNDEFDLSKFNKIYLIGGGKATAEMALTLERILINSKDIDYKGIINIPEEPNREKEFEKSKITINFSSHPIPNGNGVKGTKSMMEIIENSNEHDLIFCLISGGGSALLPLPTQDINLEDLQRTNSLLLSSGVSIHEINTIRKHLSDFKGGNLAKKLYNSSRATLISLIISDVVGDDLSSIASGPTVPDKTTFQDALEILKKYKLLGEIPTAVKIYFEKGLSNKELETPKPNDKCFFNVYNYLIGSVASATEEIKAFLKIKGFKVKIFSNYIIGEARECGETLFKIISENLEESNKSEKIALIGTGELTVTIRGKGIGGRNQEMLLSFINSVKERKFNYNFLIIGVNLDGIEGNSKAMGALVDNYVLERYNFKNVDLKKFLENNDSNSFFKELGTELLTGPTGCNVNDLVLILVSKQFF